MLDTEIRDAFLKQLDSESEIAVRRMLIGTLAQHLEDDAEIRAKILEVAEAERDGEGRLTAFNAIMQFFDTDAAARAVVERSLESDEEKIRLVAFGTIRGAARDGDERSREILVSRLRHPVSQMRQMITEEVEELVRSDLGSLRPMLLEQLDSADPDLRTQAVRLLGAGGRVSPDQQDDLGAPTRTAQQAGADEVLEAVGSLNEEISRLLETDVTDIERGFLLGLASDLSLFADLLTRSTPAEVLEQEVSRLQRLKDAFEKGAQRPEVALLVTHLDKVIDLVRQLPT